MPSLYVEFTDAVREHPVVYGRKCRTDILNIPAATEGADSSLEALAGQNIVDIYAEAQCWVAIGTDPDPEGATRRFMAAGERRQFWIDTGESVSVIGA